jgi:hypothetical protein
MDAKHIGGLTRIDWGIHNLGMDEKYTVVPEIIKIISPIDGKPNWVSGADIAILVDYQPWFLPIKRRSAFRFVTHKNDDGTFLWYSHPLR